MLTISQTMWCQEVSNILLKEEPENQQDAEEVDDVDNVVLNELMAFEKVNFDRLNRLATLVRTNIPKLHRSNITALITVDVHARDIITDMVRFVYVFERFENMYKCKVGKWILQCALKMN